MDFFKIMNEQDFLKEYLTVSGKKAHDIHHIGISASTLKSFRHFQFSAATWA